MTSGNNFNTGLNSGQTSIGSHRAGRTLPVAQGLAARSPPSPCFTGFISPLGFILDAATRQRGKKKKCCTWQICINPRNKSGRFGKGAAPGVPAGGAVNDLQDDVGTEGLSKGHCRGVRGRAAALAGLTRPPGSKMVPLSDFQRKRAAGGRGDARQGVGCAVGSCRGWRLLVGDIGARERGRWSEAHRGAGSMGGAWMGCGCCAPVGAGVAGGSAGGAAPWGRLCPRSLPLLCMRRGEQGGAGSSLPA